MGRVGVAASAAGRQNRPFAMTRTTVELQTHGLLPMSRGHGDAIEEDLLGM